MNYSSSWTANVILEGAYERAIVGNLYCDIPLGLYVIRGENVVLIGELVYTFLFFLLLSVFENFKPSIAKVSALFIGLGEGGASPTYYSGPSRRDKKGKSHFLEVINSRLAKESSILLSKLF